jgi:type IV pilus assembly protein PilA
MKKSGFIPLETPSRELAELSNTNLLCQKKSLTGFTLLEILLVVGIIAILAGIVIVALNPTKQFAAVRNTQRKANLSELNKALYQYYIDNSRYPTSVPTTNLGEICNTGATSTGHSISCTGYVDLSALVPTYLVAIPTDPQASGTSTGYLVAKNSANKIYVKALNAELSQTVALGPSDGILPDHLVSYWSFDGNANDSQGTNHGSLVGSPTATSGVRGLASTAYAFNGSADYITVNHSSNLLFDNNFSISLWFNFNGTGSPASQEKMMGKAVNDPGGFYIARYFNSLQVSSGGNWGAIQTNWGGWTNGLWESLILTWSRVDSSTLAVTAYKNGSYFASGSASNLTIGTGLLFIGRSEDAHYFNGKLDNVRIYNKALSADEALAIYNSEKP